MSKLIKIRNKVMHFKPINYGEFNDNIENCDNILKLLEQAEKEIDFKFTDKITDADNCIIRKCIKIDGANNGENRKCC